MAARIFKQVTEVSKVSVAFLHSAAGGIGLRWERPQVGEIKVNVDGAVAKDVAGMGAIIRDHRGQWMGGFIGHLGRNVPIEQAEMTVVKWGLLAVRDGLVKARGIDFLTYSVIVESDCRYVVEMLNGIRTVPQDLMVLKREIHVIRL